MSEDEKKEDNTEFPSTIAEPPCEHTKQSELGERQGATFFGCCCDFRRAVVILGILGIIWQGVFFVISLLAIIEGISANREETNGIVIVAIGLAVILAIVSGLAMCFFGLHILGAVKYNLCMLWCVLVLDAIFFALQLWYAFAQGEGTGPLVLNLFALIPWILCIYGLGGLVTEIKAGIIRKETYPRETYSCCCRPSVEV